MSALAAPASLPLRRLAFLWRRHRSFLAGAAIVCAFALAAMLAPVLAPYDAIAVFKERALQAPSALHPFGTDANGMDVFSRVIAGARYAFAIAIPSVVIGLAIGVPLGLVAGYRGGLIDEAVMRVLDVFRAFPTIILALAIVSATGQSLLNVILVIGLVDAPIFTRLVRAEVLALRRSDMVASAIAAGNSTPRLLFVHLLPNAIRGATAQVAVRMAWAIRISATLAFIGVGIQVPAPEWGAMIRQGAEHVISGEWWIAAFPGAALVLLVFGFNLLGDGAQAMLDPRLRAGRR